MIKIVAKGKREGSEDAPLVALKDGKKRHEPKKVQGLYMG